ncbi:hypothetical protein WICMUC_000526 [Wickerhamomyces mucosus]|uniref:ATP-dependent DNA helicase n=1 Tax=Wickerhamomyces mucosus TaxID=1378264 RepID=A0A9P8PYX9_9ASCO|nr:hypothetical protein WICMUC_000526 [Wickerhamomyces mucosus]
MNSNSTSLNNELNPRSRSFHSETSDIDALPKKKKLKNEDLIKVHKNLEGRYKLIEVPPELYIDEFKAKLQKLGLAKKSEKEKDRDSDFIEIPSSDDEFQKIKSEDLNIKIRKRSGRCTLNSRQRAVVGLALNSHNIFFSGSAGTGKSFLLRTLIKKLKRKFGKGYGRVVVKASTGLAAFNIRGSTLHSFAGIGLGKAPAYQLISKIQANRRSRNSWKKAKVLIIDEISMIDGDLFDKLNLISKSIRRCDDPFGGIQLICCGDFFQLPPVFNQSLQEELANYNEKYHLDHQDSLIREDEFMKTEARFCFDTDSWREVIRSSVILNEVYRQRGDPEFIEILNEMRYGKISKSNELKIRALERELPKSSIEPAELYSTRRKVDRSNLQKLSALPEPTETYIADDSGAIDDKELTSRLLSNLIVPTHIVLRKGAQVVMLKNRDRELVNGSLGEVIDLTTLRTHVTSVSTEGSSHFTDIDDSFFEYLKKKIRNQDSDEELSDTQMKFIQNVLCRKYPLVEFITPYGETRTELITQEVWSIEDRYERVIASRTRLPIMLVWALSIHKSQGQTLPRVKVDLKNVFENDQAYVAISRAVSTNGLQV